MIIDPADVIAIRRAADIRQESADGAGSNCLWMRDEWSRRCPGGPQLCRRRPAHTSHRQIP